MYASSAATYGDGTQGYDDECDPRILKPLNLYGESKQRFDLWALEQAKTPPRWAGLKYFNVYGPRMDAFGAYTEVMIRWMERLAKEQPCLILGDGAQTMDFVFVADIARATGRSKRTVERVLQQARQKLGDLLQGEK